MLGTKDQGAGSNKDRTEQDDGQKTKRAIDHRPRSQQRPSPGSSIETIPRPDTPRCQRAPSVYHARTRYTPDNRSRHRRSPPRRGSFQPIPVEAQGNLLDFWSNVCQQPRGILEWLGVNAPTINSHQSGFQKHQSQGDRGEQHRDNDQLHTLQSLISTDRTPGQPCRAGRYPTGELLRAAHPMLGMR